LSADSETREPARRDILPHLPHWSARKKMRSMSWPRPKTEWGLRKRVPPNSYVARSLHIGHRIVTLRLEREHMDIDALHSALLSLTVLAERIRSARDNAPAATGRRPHAFGQFVNSVERDLLIAKATLAPELGFPVCQCCWPPELFVIDTNGSALCPRSRKAASTKTRLKKPSRNGAFLRIPGKPRSSESFKRARKNRSV
jgi:hypothetical protein